MSSIGSASALFKNKIYLLGGYISPRGLGLFDLKKPLIKQLEKRIFAFDIENMLWEKLPETILHFSQNFYNHKADVVGDLIYLYPTQGHEFLIFDPGKNFQ